MNRITPPHAMRKKKSIGLMYDLQPQKLDNTIEGERLRTDIISNNAFT
jgi:hypothetical protein